MRCRECELKNACYFLTLPRIHSQFFLLMTSSRFNKRIAIRRADDGLYDMHGYDEFEDTDVCFITLERDPKHNTHDLGECLFDIGDWAFKTGTFVAPFEAWFHIVWSTCYILHHHRVGATWIVKMLASFRPGGNCKVLPPSHVDTAALDDSWSAQLNDAMMGAVPVFLAKLGWESAVLATLQVIEARGWLCEWRAKHPTTFDAAKDTRVDTRDVFPSYIFRDEWMNMTMSVSSIRFMFGQVNTRRNMLLSGFVVGSESVEPLRKKMRMLK